MWAVEVDTDVEQPSMRSLQPHRPSPNVCLWVGVDLPTGWPGLNNESVWAWGAGRASSLAHKGFRTAHTWQGPNNAALLCPTAQKHIHGVLV